MRKGGKKAKEGLMECKEEGKSTRRKVGGWEVAGTYRERAR